MIPNKWNTFFGLLTGTIVAAAILSGFVMLGSPMTERQRRLDERRIDELREISVAIERMVVTRSEGSLIQGEWKTGNARLKRQLPAGLKEVAAFVETEEYHRQVQLSDPQTGEPYGYRTKDETTFELCATFSLAREEQRDMFWNHPAGQHCFTINVLGDTE